MSIVKETIIYGKNYKKDNGFHIVFGIDDDFVRPLGILMTSIIKNNSDENIIFHIISRYINENNKNLLKQFSLKLILI